MQEYEIGEATMCVCVCMHVCAHMHMYQCLLEFYAENKEWIIYNCVLFTLVANGNLNLLFSLQGYLVLDGCSLIFTRTLTAR